MIFLKLCAGSAFPQKGERDAQKYDRFRHQGRLHGMAPMEYTNLTCERLNTSHIS